jgi:hypothetical protein
MEAHEQAVNPAQAVQVNVIVRLNPLEFHVLVRDAEEGFHDGHLRFWEDEITQSDITKDRLSGGKSISTVIEFVLDAPSKTQ